MSPAARVRATVATEPEPGQDVGKGGAVVTLADRIAHARRVLGSGLPQEAAEAAHQAALAELDTVALKLRTGGREYLVRWRRRGEWPISNVEGEIAYGPPERRIYQTKRGAEAKVAALCGKPTRPPVLPPEVTLSSRPVGAWEVED